MSTRRVLITLAIVAGLALTGCKPAATTAPAPAADAKPPVATVNGQPISADMFAVFVQMQSGGKKPEDIPADKRKEMLDLLVGIVAGEQEAEKENLGQDPDVRGRLELNKVNILFSALAQKYLKEHGPTDAEIRAEYDAKVAAAPKAEYRARHILVKSEDEAVANDVIAKLGKGAKFEDLAKQYSIDPSKGQGGELGWFSPNSMAPEFSAAVMNLKKGEYTKAPVKTQFGWHVIQLEDTRPVTAPAFDQVKDRVAAMLKDKKLRDYIEQLRKAAKVEEKS
jgi:peptidyl-prolyl cis-trans isomerase C